MSAVLCVGEVLVSLAPPRGIALCEASDLLVSTGGAEANVAVALAALGFEVRFAGRLGDDALGVRLQRALDEAGIDTRHLERIPGGRTGLYLKDGARGSAPMVYYRSGSAASTYRRVPPAALAGVDHIHVTGITAALSRACLRLVEGLLDGRARGATTSFDVNFRPALWDAEAAAPALASLASRSDIVFVGLDEAALLWGCTTAEDVRALLPVVPELVVKHGAEPVVVFQSDARVEVPGRVVEVVEPIGAGDAFAAGYLAGRRVGEDIRVAARWGHALAGEVLRVRGDHVSSHSIAELAVLADLHAAEGGTNR